MRLLDDFSRAGAVRFTGRRGAPVSPANKVHSNMRCILGLVTLLLTLVAFGPSTALASGVWSAPAKVATGIGFVSVSCPSATFCVGLGTNGGPTGYALTYNGKSWTAPKSIDNTQVLSMSCPSAKFCVAIDFNGNALTYNGRSWSAPVHIGGSQDDVSCSSATFCVVVGHNGVTEEPNDVLSFNSIAVTYNGTSWSPTHLDGVGWLDFVSCSSRTFCLGIGSTGVGGDPKGIALTYNGTSWTTPTNIAHHDWIPCPSVTFCVAPPTNIGPIGPVSCASASFCVAVGHGGHTFTYNGRSWSASGRIGAGYAEGGLSCASASFCVAVDGKYAVTYTNGNRRRRPSRKSLEAAD